MPTVAQEGGLSFVIRTKEHPPPHVHVFRGSEELCRIRLADAAFMEDLPPGDRQRIREAYTQCLEIVWAKWAEFHGG